MSEQDRPPLLVAKGAFKAMGGAEMDLIRVLPAMNRVFDVTMATIQPSEELVVTCSENGIRLIRPESNWELHTDPVSVILDSGRRTSSRAWASCPGLREAMESSIAMHLVSGDGSLPILDHVPGGLMIHLHLLEPHRGLYEDTLHLRLDGSPRRSLTLTRAALSRARRRDQSLILDLMSRGGSLVSGNSSFSAKRAKEVYGIEAGVLWPCVDTEEFPSDPSSDPENPYPKEGEYVVSIGRASYAKGTWETVSMLSGTGIGLAHVGGGDDESIEMIKSHASKSGVEIWISPRLESSDLVSLMRGARAVVSMAHNESFGLTPIESFAVGTPALFVDEGGFRDTIIDGVNGRLLPREDLQSWHKALIEASEEKTRRRWAEAGRQRISELDLSPQAHARRIYELITDS